MGYRELWNALADLSKELKSKGVTSPETIRNLRSVKTLISIHEADTGYTENLMKIEIILANVESTLILAAQDEFETEIFEKWMNRIREARLAKENRKSAIASRFVPGIPRGKPWIRLETSVDLPKEEIKKLADELNLSWKKGEDNWAFIWGEKNLLKEFIAEIRNLVRRSD